MCGMDRNQLSLLQSHGTSGGHSEEGGGSRGSFLGNVMLEVGLLGWGELVLQRRGRKAKHEQKYRGGVCRFLRECQGGSGAWSPPECSDKLSAQEMGEGEQTGPCSPSPGHFLLQPEFCVVDPWSDSPGLCDWSAGLLGPQVSVRGPCGAWTAASLLPAAM